MGGSVSTTSTGFRGVSLASTRGATARKELEIDWNFPVYTPPDQSGRTRAPEVRKALELLKAYNILAGKDNRPLLVLREFSTYDDPGNEKLSRKLYTEKTVLLSHWFNCIRLPHHVTEKDHPFNTLYQNDHPPQLFLASTDGSSMIPFNYKSSRVSLEKQMSKVLNDYYVKNPTKVVSQLVKMLPKFDNLDWKIQDLKEKLDKAIEEIGPKSSKTKKIRKELDRAEAERTKLEEQKKNLRKIPLIQAEKPKS